MQCYRGVDILKILLTEGLHFFFFKFLEKFLCFFGILDQSFGVALHASEFHFGVDVVKMHILNLCNCRMYVFNLGRFPVPMDDGMDLGINNPLRLSVGGLWCRFCWSFF